MSKYQTTINRGLTIFFALAFAINIGFVLIGLASVPGYYQHVTTQTVEPYIVGNKIQFSNEIATSESMARGLSLSAYAIYKIALNVLLALIPTFVALLIAWRARWQWFAWYSAFVIVFLGAYVLNDQMIVARLVSREIYGSTSIFWFLLLPYFYLFPNGMPVPRRILWLEILLVLYHSAIQTGTVITFIAPDLASAIGMPNWGNTIWIIPVLLNFVITFGCQVYRYRRVSTPTERQQTKWFLFGFALIVVTLPAFFFIKITGYLADLLTDSLLYLVIPLSLAIAVLRYRLWDIDILIRRTLIYSIITAMLALFYFGAVIFLQQLFRSLTGAGDDLAIIVSTLALAALVNPLRRRVQNAIDHRFYRRKYDAQKVLESFAATARDEVELDKLTGELLRVVDETMQPAHVSLWLKKTDDRKPALSVSKGWRTEG